MNVQYASLAKVPNQVGFMVLNEDGAVIVSQGDLENDERIANIAIKMANCVKGQLEPVKRILVVFPDHHYTVCGSNRKVIIMKQQVADDHVRIV